MMLTTPHAQCAFDAWRHDVFRSRREQPWCRCPCSRKAIDAIKKLWRGTVLPYIPGVLAPMEFARLAP